MLFSKEELYEALKTTKTQNVYTQAHREKILNTPYLANAIEQLREKSAEEAKSPIPSESFTAFEQYFSTGSRMAFSAEFNPKRHKLALHAMSAWLFEDEVELHRTEDALWAIMNEYSWAPPYHITLGTTEENKKNVSLDVVMHDDTFVIDLLAAETAGAIAECLLMLGDKLHPFVAKRARFELERRIFTPFLTRQFVWESKRNNWPSVCASNICYAALAVVEDTDRLVEIFEKALPSLERFLSGFASDGTCLEGLGYWNYGFGPFVALADCLMKRTEGKIDLFKFDIVEKVSKFYYRCFFKGQRTVSFADGNTSSPFVASTHSILMERFPELAVPKDFVNLDLHSDGRLHHIARFFNLTTERFALSDGKKFGTHIFPAAQWYISSSTNDVGLAAKGGNNAEPHNHNDVGSFEIYLNGEDIISDIGCGEYTLDYFSKNRYNCFAPSSRSHSVPIINGTYQCAGEQHAAENVTIDEDGIRLELARAYQVPTLSSLVRDLRFDRENGTVTLTDSYLFTETPTSVCERLITTGEATLDTEGVLCVRNGAERMYVFYDKDALLLTIGKEYDTARYSEPRETTVIDLAIKEKTTAFTITLRIQTEK